MGILVLEAAPGDEHPGILQCTDHRLVGIALLALVGDDALAFEARRILGEEAIGIDGEGDGTVHLLHPDIVVVGAMAGCGVHEAGAGVIGDVIAFEKRDIRSRNPCSARGWLHSQLP